MADIDNNTNATQLLEAANTAFGNTDGIQEILASDNATDFIEKLNHNFEVMGTGGDAVFPANTILPSSIGSLEQGEDISGMTLADFITYGIQNKPHKFTFLHMSDPHGNMDSINDADTRMSNDTDIKVLVITGDMQTYISSYQGVDRLSAKMKEMGNAGKMLAVVGNHDAAESMDYNGIYMRNKMNDWFINENDVPMVDFGSTEQYGSYWIKDYPLGNGKLRIFGLDIYNYPGDYNGQVSGYANCITSDQVDWFVAKLRELNPSDYFMVAAHEPLIKGGGVPQDKRAVNKFCSSRLKNWGNMSSNGNFFPAIIRAYIRKRAVSLSMTNCNVTASVDEDFSTMVHEPARFIGHLCGHDHGDMVSTHPVYTDQLIMMVDNAMNETYGLQSDLRVTDDYNDHSQRANLSGILYNKVTIDVWKETIHIERIGHKVTCTHSYNNTDWNLDEADPNFQQDPTFVYPSVTRDEITFDYTTNLVKEDTNTNNEQENEN